MFNADHIACDILYRPDDLRYKENLRIYQGCATLACTRGDRLYAGWYAGGTLEPHMDNYNLLVYSDDGGETWSEPLIVIPSSRELNIHALDIQLFCDPDGALHLCWVQNNVRNAPATLPKSSAFQPLAVVDGTLFSDFQHSEWQIICADPDAAEPVFSAPQFMFHGFMRCKPLFMKNGTVWAGNYNQLENRICYSLSTDGMRTWQQITGPEKKKTVFDEAMVYEQMDGTLRMLIRSGTGYLTQCYSTDGGYTFGEVTLSDIVSADTRFFISRLPSGRLLLIVNDHPTVRCRMTVMLSEDDGKTWPYRSLIDERWATSYPDVCLRGEQICLLYDRERVGACEMLFSAFTEQDVLLGREIAHRVISKPTTLFDKPALVQQILQEKLIAIVRGVDREQLLPTLEALYAGGVRLAEITYSADGATPDEEIADQIRLACTYFAGRMIIGAGTVLTEKQVWLTKLAGGRFIISPNTDPDIIRATYRVGLVSIPGALTPTEVAAADAAGADFVKLFPAGSMGPDYFKDLSAPLSHVKLLAVGGVTADQFTAFAAAGAVGFGISSSLVRRDLIAAGDFEALTENARQYVAAAQETAIR